MFEDQRGQFVISQHDDLTDLPSLESPCPAISDKLMNAVPIQSSEEPRSLKTNEKFVSPKYD